MNYFSQLIEQLARWPDIHPASEEAEVWLARLLKSGVGSPSPHELLVGRVGDVEGVRVALILDESPDASHKYVRASDTDGGQYLVAMPVAWCSYHRFIVVRVALALGVEIRDENVRGGWLALEHGVVECDRKSTDFGRADHGLANALFQQLVDTP